MTDSTKIHWVCEACGTVNAFAPEKLDQGPLCAHCKTPLVTGKPIAVDTAQLEKHISHNHVPVLVDFWAPWCGPCQSFAPTFEAFAESAGGQIRALKVDTEANQQAAINFHIRSIPTLALFLNGREIGRISGALPLPQLQQWVVQTLQENG